MCVHSSFVLCAYILRPIRTLVHKLLYQPDVIDNNYCSAFDVEDDIEALSCNTEKDKHSLNVRTAGLVMHILHQFNINTLLIYMFNQNIA